MGNLKVGDLVRWKAAVQGDLAFGQLGIVLEETPQYHYKVKWFTDNNKIGIHYPCRLRRVEDEGE